MGELVVIGSSATLVYIFKSFDDLGQYRRAQAQTQIIENVSPNV